MAYEYPMWFKGKEGEVVKFISLTNGITVLKDEVTKCHFKSKFWIPHTNTDIWTDVTDQYKGKEMETIQAIKYDGKLFETVQEVEVYKENKKNEVMEARIFNDDYHNSDAILIRDLQRFYKEFGIEETTKFIKGRR